MTLPTWSVTAMVDEPAPLVAAFAHHMLAIGAAGVELFLDQPNPQAQELLADLPGCRLTLMDEAFWAATEGGMRPPKKPDRQYAAAEIAYRRAPGDWLLHCDFDEFLRSADALMAELATLPDDITHVSLRMSERVALTRPGGLYGGVFRRRHADYATMGEGLHGDMAMFFHNGLSGHFIGKSFTRTGRALRPTIHYAVSSEHRDFQHGKPLVYTKAARLLHFDGLTPLHFAIKILRHTRDPQSDLPRNPADMPPERRAQMQMMQDLAGDPAALARFVVRMMTLTPRQADMLRAARLLEERPFRPRVPEALSQMLTPAAVDRRLRARHYAMLSRHAPQLLDPQAWAARVAEAVLAAEAGAAGVGPSGEQEVGDAEL